MEKIDFNTEIKKLQENFGKNLKSDQIILLYDYLRHIPLWKFENLSDYIIKNKEIFKFTIAEFLNAIQEMPAETREIKQSSVITCMRCDSSGVISYTKKINRRLYSFIARCNCPAADNLSRQIARYDDLFPDEPYEKQFLMREN